MTGIPRIQPGVSWGNLISPAISILVLGIPALIWAGRIDTRVETMASSITTVRAEMADIKATSNTTASALVGINYTISEGLKANIAETVRRVVNLEQRVDRQADEITRLQIELATIKRASEPPARRP